MVRKRGRGEPGLQAHYYYWWCCLPLSICFLKSGPTRDSSSLFALSENWCEQISHPFPQAVFLPGAGGRRSQATDPFISVSVPQVQHLYFSATWFQTWKSCIWCWKLSSHQTAYFKTQHLMPEVWKKYFSSSTCIPKAGEVFLNLTGEHKSWTEDDSIVRVTYLTFQNVFGNDPWHFSHKTVSINIVCLKKGLNLQWQGYLLRKVKFNK